ncbi:MAG TPA: alpha-galactosidase [Opitutaceae bacterium]|nr:alpha-galactosidase [Opitutaceae bacterium]
MPIVDLGNAWWLETPSATYVLGVTPEGWLQHWHWGGRIRPTESLGNLRPRVYRGFSPTVAGAADDALSFDTLPSEYPFPDTGDFRVPALEIEHGDGSRALRLRYHSHRITPGKPPLAGLPSTYVEDAAEADTLEIELVDAPSGLRVTLAYTTFAGQDAIARSARFHNGGTAPCRLRTALSASVDLGERDRWRWLQLSGTWARERHLIESPLRPGTQSVESRRGTSSHQHNPFFALLAPDAGEEHGEVLGFSLVYSGNFIARVECDAFGTARCQLGINPAGFCWRLEPGETFQTPEAVLVYSGAGLGAMSRTYHRLYRTRLCRGPHRDRPRPVLINNWEATYFDFDQPRLVELARRAAGIGVELFVLDDGWFGRRNNDRTSLGDWQPNPAKLPAGLDGLAAAIRKEGLAFGLWLEPEMVSPESDFYREHPDWCLHLAGRERTTSRHQLVLDLSRDEVGAAVYAQVARILRDAPISYVKWDMNRHLTEVGSAGSDRQGEIAHRYVLGLYRLLERITGEFPHVLFEACSGGGGRFDPGILAYMPQVWVSDNSDAISRLFIQHGTSLVYPLSAMSAHISAVPNHQVGRTTPLRTRGLVAMTGAFGLELDLSQSTAEEMTELATLIAQHRQWQTLLATGDLYRLRNPSTDGEAAWMVVRADRREALVFHVTILTEANAPLRRLRLRGLDAKTQYRDVETGYRLGGDALMAHGLVWADDGDFRARCFHLQAE